MLKIEISQHNEDELDDATTTVNCIFACYAQVPFFLVEYHGKCTDFLNDVGQDASYRIQDGELSPVLVAEKIADIVTSQYYIPPIHLEETQSRSLLNFTDTAQYFL
jgi:hypothetical protein